jgi:hypothetical protein
VIVLERSAHTEKSIALFVDISTTGCADISLTLAFVAQEVDRNAWQLYLS